MKRTTPRLWICGTLIGLLLAVIWGNSCLNGETSGQFSGWVADLLHAILPFLSSENEVGHFILRKLGHFSEFAALGLLLRWMFGMTINRKWLTLVLPLGCAVMAAFIDETIQIFTPGRYSSIVDVGIDSLGALTGILVLQIGWLLLRRLRRKG